MQALQRLHASKPAAPGFVERIEEHYIRRGTQCLTANLEVATGRILTPTLASTRNEEDFANHILRTLSTDLDGEWIFIIDNLNTHKSESLVHLVAELCDLDQELGVKGRGGIMLDNHPRRVPRRFDTPHSLRLHPQARLLAQSGRTVVQYPCTSTTQAR